MPIGYFEMLQHIAGDLEGHAHMQCCVCAQVRYETSPGTYLWLSLSPVQEGNDEQGRLVNCLSIENISHHTHAYIHTHSLLAKVKNVLIQGI